MSNGEGNLERNKLKLTLGFYKQCRK